MTGLSVPTETAVVRVGVRARVEPVFESAVWRGDLPLTTRTRWSDWSLWAEFLVKGTIWRGIAPVGPAVMGAGLPAITPERERLSGYFNDRLEDRFARACRYPGVARVLQAVGRLESGSSRGRHGSYQDFFPPLAA